MLTNNEIFNIIQNPSKLQQLKQINETLKFTHNIIIFVYTPPKVGSTSLVSSFRIFCIHKINIIHIHDEIMLKVLTGIDDVTINEIIAYNKYIGKQVYVIDIYRSPIERKISSYFEKIGTYHFNNIDSQVNNYNVNMVIHRFNKIFPFLSNGDHFIDLYPLTNKPEKFDFNNKYLLVEDFGIKYIKLRLKDSNQWSSILTKLINIPIYIVKDYETTNKPVKDLYKQFKENYQIPKNLLDDIMKCKYLNYYYNTEELHEYYNIWNNKSTNDFVSFTENEYKLYEYITLENSHLDYIQLYHYIDEGCICKACNIKRTNIANKIRLGTYNNEKIIHEEAKKELLTNRVVKVNKINKAIQNLPGTTKIGRKDIKNQMKNIVSNKR